jgi:3-dehydroquinate dehydratase II
MQILIINGPNLNLLGKREPEVYGKQTFEEYFQTLKAKYAVIRLQYFQSNHEGEIIDKLHETGFLMEGIILNAGGYTHTSVAIMDAIAAITSPVLEVHISNIYAREEFRHKSYLTKNCVGMISGLGLMGYDLAVQYFLSKSQG